MRLAVKHQADQARALVEALSGAAGETLCAAVLAADQSTEAGIAAQRDRVAELASALAGIDDPRARRLEQLAEYLVERAVWIVGGDGWAYDIGYGGLDHVLASGENVNILVLDTEVYSNTGGQQSKATPMAAVAKFAAAGKGRPKKDLGLLAMAYGDVYVAHVAFGANDRHTYNAFVEAAAHPGPSLIIAYSHCIAHGYDLSLALDQHKRAVATGYWPLYRFDPSKADGHRFPLQLDSKPPSQKLPEFAYNETRFRLLLQHAPERAKQLMDEAQADVYRRWALYEQLAAGEEKS
jgi:pyruvate-ferredoxin/flavodoxin oxidoreductase